MEIHQQLIQFALICFTCLLLNFIEDSFWLASIQKVMAFFSKSRYNQISIEKVLNFHTTSHLETTWAAQHCLSNCLSLASSPHISHHLTILRKGAFDQIGTQKVGFSGRLRLKIEYVPFTN